MLVRPSRRPPSSHLNSPRTHSGANSNQDKRQAVNQVRHEHRDGDSITNKDTCREPAQQCASVWKDESVIRTNWLPGNLRLRCPDKLRVLGIQDQFTLSSSHYWNDNWGPLRYTPRSKQPSVFRDGSPSHNSRRETCRTADPTKDSVSTNE